MAPTSVSPDPDSTGHGNPIYACFRLVPMEFGGITFSETQAAQLAAVTFCLAIGLLWLRRLLQRRRLFKICGVPVPAFRLLGTSLYGLGQPVHLNKHGLRSRPSTVFMGKNQKSGYICQFNPRMFNGRVKVRERYQMILSMGLAMETLELSTMQGAIRYRDHLEAIQFEPDTYKQLLGMRQEYTEAVQNWVAPNKRPLFKRDQRP